MVLWNKNNFMQSYLTNISNPDAAEYTDISAEG